MTTNTNIGLYPLPLIGWNWNFSALQCKNPKNAINNNTDEIQMTSLPVALLRLHDPLRHGEGHILYRDRLTDRIERSSLCGGGTRGVRVLLFPRQNCYRLENGHQTWFESITDNQSIQCSPRIRSTVNRSARLFVQTLAGPDPNDVLLHENIRIRVQKLILIVQLRGF